MNCKTYIFKLTSGQLSEARPLEKIRAFQHRLICHHCRAFTRNHRLLDKLLAHYREALWETTAAEATAPEHD